MYLLRSRWAAIGAAVAVTLGAGGLISVGASNDTSSLVPITPTRVLDTRSGDRVGSLDTAGASDPYRLKVTGGNGIPASGVTAVSLNVTAVGTQTNDYGGFLSVYPCASVSTTKPDVSNMNWFRTNYCERSHCSRVRRRPHLSICLRDGASVG